MFDHVDASLPAVPSRLLSQIWRRSEPATEAVAATAAAAATSGDNDDATSEAKQALEAAQADFYQAAIRFRHAMAMYNQNPMLERMYTAAKEAMHAKNAAGQKMNAAQHALDQLTPADASANRVPYRAQIFNLPLPERPRTVSARMELDRL